MKALGWTFILYGMLACGSEMMQLFIDGRSALFSEVLIDMAGCSVGILLSILLRKGKERP